MCLLGITRSMSCRFGPAPGHRHFSPPPTRLLIRVDVVGVKAVSCLIGDPDFRRNAAIGYRQDGPLCSEVEVLPIISIFGSLGSVLSRSVVSVPSIDAL